MATAVRWSIREPRALSTATTHASPGTPQSPFPPYERPSGIAAMWLYDFDTSEVEDHGMGSAAMFTDDGRYAVWTRMDGQPGREVVMALDLETGEEHVLGQGRRFPQYCTGTLLPPDEVLIQRNGEVVVVDIATRETQQAGPRRLPPNLPGMLWDGLVLEYVDEVGRIPLPPSHIEVAMFRQSLSEPGAATPRFEFDATRTAYAGDGSFVLATPAIEEGGRWLVNLFAVDLDSGAGEYIATVEILLQLPLTANERYVAWNERYCDYEADEPRALRVYDRQTGELIEIDSALTAVELDGTLLGLSYSGFGADAWLDLETMEWHEVMPAGSIHASWSPDHRYASLGYVGGHGGLCG